MKYAILKDDVVVNVIEYETQPSTPPAGFGEGHEAIQEDYVSVGWHYVDGKFVDPNPPETVERLNSISLTDMILADPAELAKLKTALGI